jgi:hypothetical protein
MDEQTQNRSSNLRRFGTFLFGAARRVLGTAGQRMKQRWSEVRQPVARRGTAQRQSPGSSSDVSQPAT